MRLPCLGVQAGEESDKGVGGGQTAGQGKVTAKPRLLAPPEGGDLFPVVRAAGNGTNRDDDDVQEEVLTTMPSAWVFQAAKVFLDFQGLGGHGRTP
jgi:hypothetical protein